MIRWHCGSSISAFWNDVRCLLREISYLFAKLYCSLKTKAIYSITNTCSDLTR